ncbi:MAG: 3-phosphoshikimate 1-carboxyvinyltransferase [Dehalococcoidia bacterium]|nr:3-phosphoshikimate 1-carboxyvinyltransferase [Dehalococcoidia bacterium]
MRVTIEKSDIRGKATAPPSKSYTIRGLMCAALARGESQIVHPLYADDTEVAVRVLSDIGAGVEQSKDLWRISGGDLRQPDADLYCGDSAATLRFMTAIGSILPGKCRLTAGASLAGRPVGPLVEALRRLGVDCSSDNGVAPVVVSGGRLKGGETELPGDVSSQFLSALLLVSPFAEEGMHIRLTTPLESKPYVAMTLDSMARFGINVTASAKMDDFYTAKQTYQPTSYEVEGDWSSASYLLALGAVTEGMEVENLNSQSLQSDRVMLEFLRRMGAEVEVSPGAIRVRGSKLKALRADLSDCIDLLPTVAVLAALAEGTSEFEGIGRARLKESNRVAAVREGLERMGVKVAEEENRLLITGSNLKGAVVDSYDDHRIAMAFSILGTQAGNTTINGAECVSKTFPEFWDILKSIGGRLKIDG